MDSEFYPEKYYTAQWSVGEWKKECLRLFYALDAEKVKVQLAENRYQRAQQQIKALSHAATLNEGLDTAKVAEIVGGSI